MALHKIKLLLLFRTCEGRWVDFLCSLRRGTHFSLFHRFPSEDSSIRFFYKTSIFAHSGKLERKIREDKTLYACLLLPVLPPHLPAKCEIVYRSSDMRVNIIEYTTNQLAA